MILLELLRHILAIALPASFMRHILAILLAASFIWSSCCGLDVQVTGEVTRVQMSSLDLPEEKGSNGAETTIDSSSLSLLHQKLLLLLGMLLTTIFSALLPLKLYRVMGVSRRNSTWEAVITFSSCFSGGVFMAAAFLDLIPETNFKIKEVLELIRQEFGVTIRYPVTEFTILVGFLLVLGIEQIVLHYQETWAEAEDCSLERGSPLLESSTHYKSVPSQEPIMSSETLETNCSSSSSHELDGLSSSQVSHVHHDDHGKDDHGDHSHVTPAIFQQSVLRSFLLLLALTFHSIFEGIAIGLQEASTSLLSLFIAVIVHKCIMSFSLGLNLAQSQLSVKSYLLCILIFASASPLGVGIGIGVVGLPESLTQDIISGILQAMAAGTFLYITFFEVLPHELNLPRRRISKFLFVILGFAIMCILLLVAPHDHGDKHDHGGAHEHVGSHPHGGRHEHVRSHQHGNVDDLSSSTALNRSFLTDAPPYFESHRMNNAHGNDKHYSHEHGHDVHIDGYAHEHDGHSLPHARHAQGHNYHAHDSHNHGYASLVNKNDMEHSNSHNHNGQTNAHDSHEHHKHEHDSHENDNSQSDSHQHQNDKYDQDSHEHDVYNGDAHVNDVHDGDGHDHGNNTFWDIFGF